MIGKVKNGSNPSGILNYCYYEKGKLSADERQKLTLNDVRGELIYVQNLGIKTLSDGRFDMDYLANQFKECADKNQNLKKYVWHQSFSFPNGENPTKEQIQQISNKFAQDFGFIDNQLIVFKHTDTNHSHFHIVANRINSEGRTTANDGFSHLKTGTFCRKIELEMGFSITPNMKALSPTLHKEKSPSQAINRIRDKIDEGINQIKSFENLINFLQKEGIKIYQGRGISFVDKTTGVKCKGSELGRNYSLMNIEKRLAESNDLGLKPERGGQRGRSRGLSR